MLSKKKNRKYKLNKMYYEIKTGYREWLKETASSNDSSEIEPNICAQAN